MKVTLEFDLDGEDTEFDLKAALGANSFRWALCDIRQYLREAVKYRDLPESQSAAFREMYEKFFAIIDEHDIDSDLVG